MDKAQRDRLKSFANSQAYIATDRQEMLELIPDLEAAVDYIRSLQAKLLIATEALGNCADRRCLMADGSNLNRIAEKALVEIAGMP